MCLNENFCDYCPLIPFHNNGSSLSRRDPDLITPDSLIDWLKDEQPKKEKMRKTTMIKRKGDVK